jgi:hypothetical protein
MRPGIFVPLK